MNAPPTIQTPRNTTTAGRLLATAAAAFQRGERTKALADFHAALAAAPQSLTVLCRFAEFLRLAGRPADAMHLYDRAMKIERANVEVLRGVGSVFHEMGRPEQALAALKIALKIAPQDAQSHACAGSVHLGRGDREAAAASFRTALEINPGNLLALLGLAAAEKTTAGDARFATLDALKTRGLGDADRSVVHFTLGRMYADTEQYDEAFAEYVTANALRDGASGGPFDIDDFARRVELKREVFDKDFFAARNNGVAPQTGPIFVVGMPRSGTTLVESILDRHPQCHGAGELATVNELRVQIEGAEVTPTARLADLWRGLRPEALGEAGRLYLAATQALAPQAKCIVDKMPHNFEHLWLIALMLPGSRIVHCRRNPRDTCVSLFCAEMRDGHGYKNHLETLGRYYARYETLCNHWREDLPLPILEMQYEELVADQETHSRRLVEFCGLEWDPACLDFERGRESVMTASALQVRKRIYSTSVGRWRRYADHLEPLLKHLR